MKIKFWLFKFYWIMLPISVIAVCIVYYSPLKFDFKIISTIFGIILSSIYFIQKQGLEEIRLFREIFLECNKRYDSMNDDLNNIIRGDVPLELTEIEKNKLDDYFNLCGEEYLYFKQGYIYPDVWLAWENGMKVMVANSRIGKYWEQEKNSNSYYGLPLKAA